MKKKLTKSRTDVVFTGTLGGIAEYFGIDSTIVRLVYVLLVFFGIGSPILVYLLLALIIPKKPLDFSTGEQTDSQYSQQNYYYQSRSSGTNDSPNGRKDVTHSIHKKE